MILLFAMISWIMLEKEQFLHSFYTYTVGCAYLNPVCITNWTYLVMSCFVISYFLKSKALCSHLVALVFVPEISASNLQISGIPNEYECLNVLFNKLKAEKDT